MTFIHEHDPYPLKMYLQTKNELSTSRRSKVIALQADRHKCTDGCHHNYYHATLWVVTDAHAGETHIGSDVVRCRAEDDDLLPDDETSLIFDPAVLLLADRTLLYSPHSHTNNNSSDVARIEASFSILSGEYLSLTLFLSNLWEYCHMLLKIRFFGLNFGCRQYVSNDNHFVLIPKATTYGEITQNNGHYAVQHHFRWQIWRSHHSIRSSWKPHAVSKHHSSMFYRTRVIARVLHCGSMNFRPVWFLNPWPWPDDLHIRTWPIFPGDIPLVGIWTSYCQGFRIWQTHTQTRHTDRHDRNYIPHCFVGGQ